MLISVGRSSHAPEVVDFLRRLDYGVEVVAGDKVEASPPAGWPEPLAWTALEHFIGAWNRAHPDQDVVIAGEGRAE